MMNMVFESMDESVEIFCFLFGHLLNLENYNNLYGPYVIYY